MTSQLKGMRILFFGLETFGYEKRILDEMLAQGAIVDYYSVRSVRSKIGKSIAKFAPTILSAITDLYYEIIRRKISKNVYDTILFIKCDMVTCKTLRSYRHTFKNAKMRLHLWDSLNNIKGIESKLRFFDRITSFDREDCRNHPEFGFRPLFYANDYMWSDKQKDECEKPQYHISFCGTIHTDRYYILETVRRICEKSDLKFYHYYYLQSRFVYFVYRITNIQYRKARVREFKYKSLSAGKVSEIMRESMAIFDIQHPGQTGLTMRTIETIGMRKKLITTNKDVVNYDFYNPNNVYVMDRSHIHVPTEFLNKPYVKLPDDVYNSYSISRWVTDVLTM